MKVVIVSFYCYPENTPRAFRTYELAKYLRSVGFEVILVLPRKKVFTSLEMKGFTTYYYSHKHNKKLSDGGKEEINQDQFWKRIPKKVLTYILATKDYKYTIPVFSILNELYHQKIIKADSRFISIGLPFPVILGTAIFLSKTKIDRRNAIAEYGDPFYYQPSKKIFWIHKLIEKFALKKFGTVTIPTSKILKHFVLLTPKERINIIPQGYDFKDIEINNYQPNRTLKFGYAGLFYPQERDPTFFLKYLTSITIPFQFIVFTDKKMRISNGYSLISPFEKLLGDKLIINDLIERKKVIFELSGMDFLINIQTRDASPSKMIDYKLARRPVLEIKSNQKDFIQFEEFVKGNYENDASKSIDLEDYNIETIGRKFVELLNF